MKLLPLLCLLSPWFGPGSAQEISFGTLPFKYKIQLKEGAQPVVHAPRRVPAPLREALKRELDRMTNLAVIKKVQEPTDWVNSMVVTKKKNGGVVTVTEGADALLNCSLSFRKKIEIFDWKKDHGGSTKQVFLYDNGKHYNNGLSGQDEQFKDRVLFFEDELKAGNASIKIQRTRLEDNGTYTCVLLKPYRLEIKIRLNVGAARKPHINTIRDRVTWRLLECNVCGVPKPKLEWKSSDGKVLPVYELKEQSQDACFHVELQVNVSKTDKYTCVVTQLEIFHQINNTLEVTIPDIVTVVAGHDAVLRCSLDYKESISMVFNWKKNDKEVFFYNRSQVEENEQFKGRLSYFEAELKSGNTSVKIHNTQLADSGHYTCHFLNSEKSLVILSVVSQTGWRESYTGWIIGGVVFVYLLY